MYSLVHVYMCKQICIFVYIRISNYICIHIYILTIIYAHTSFYFTYMYTGNETLTSGTDVNGCLGLGALANPHVVYFTRLPALRYKDCV